MDGSSDPGSQTSNSRARFSGRSLVISLIIAVIAFQVGNSYGRRGYVFEPKEFKVVNQKDKVEEVDYSLLWDAIQAVNENYIDRPINQQQVLYGAVRGAVSAAGDEYTEFFSPEDLENFVTDLKGSFQGIGAEIGRKNGSLVIVAPLDESPAQRAGLLPKDIIVQVNGQSTADWSVDQAVKNIRGDKGTEVTLTIFRDGRNEPFDVKIVRDEIKVKSVKLEFKNVGSKSVAVLSVTRFGDDTKSLFDAAVREIQSRRVEAMVLDLRNNPGGYLQTSVDLASNWVPKDQLVVSEAKAQGEPLKYDSEGYGRLQNIKTVVLINEGSASASEILAGALHDHKLATLVGEKSFGKGSVQELLDLPEGSAVKITVAKWVTPSGKNLHKEGLAPDIEVKRTEDDITNNRDPQMDRALEEAGK